MRSYLVNLSNERCIMIAEGPLTTSIQDRCLNAEGLSIAEIAASAATVMQQYRICLISSFPIDPDLYLDFLNRFGTPLPNYSSLSELDKDEPHPQLNRVKYKRKSTDAKHSDHYASGELRPHSARSWCAPRPRYFSMLMVDGGWRDTAPGESAESVIVQWEYLFTQLAKRDGSVFAEHFARLSGKPVSFQANNVREELAETPLIYELEDSHGPYDVGVRLKQDLQEKIEGIRDQLSDFDCYRASLDYLVRATCDPSLQYSFLLERGNLLLIDNNRFAHGRRNMIGERLIDGRSVTNPRELWSVSVR